MSERERETIHGSGWIHIYIHIASLHDYIYLNIVVEDFVYVLINIIYTFGLIYITFF